MKTVFIYALNDPNRQHLGKTRYIGKAEDPYRRYELHLEFNYKEKTHKANWIRSLFRAGQTPILEILDEVPESEWSFWEREWIRLYRALGFDLTNGTDGGEGGIPTVETRAKMSAALSGEKNPMFGRRGKNHPMFGRTGKNHPTFGRMGKNNPMFGKSPSAETRAKLRAATAGKNNPMFGKTHSAEARSKIGAANSGEKNHNFGKSLSLETRRKISAAKLGRSRCKSFD